MKVWWAQITLRSGALSLASEPVVTREWRKTLDAVLSGTVMPDEHRRQLGRAALGWFEKYPEADWFGQAVETTDCGVVLRMNVCEFVD